MMSSSPPTIRSMSTSELSPPTIRSMSTSELSPPTIRSMSTSELSPPTIRSMSTSELSGSESELEECATWNKVEDPPSVHDAGNMSDTDNSDSYSDITDKSAHSEDCFRANENANKDLEDGLSNGSHSNKETVPDMQPTQLNFCESETMGPLEQGHFPAFESVTKTKMTDISLDRTTEMSPFMCGICLSSFKKMYEFYNHFDMHPEVTRDLFHICEDLDNFDRDLDNCNYECQVCSEAFPSLCTLENHMKLTENVPFQYDSLRLVKFTIHERDEAIQNEYKHRNIFTKSNAGTTANLISKKYKTSRRVTKKKKVPIKSKVPTKVLPKKRGRPRKNRSPDTKTELPKLRPLHRDYNESGNENDDDYGPLVTESFDSVIKHITETAAAAISKEQAGLDTSQQELSVEENLQKYTQQYLKDRKKGNLLRYSPYDEEKIDFSNILTTAISDSNTDTKQPMGGTTGVPKMKEVYEMQDNLSKLDSADAKEEAASNVSDSAKPSQPLPPSSRAWLYDDDKVECTLCGRVLKKTSVRAHWLHHSEARPYECKKCGTKFKTKYMLKSHNKCDPDRPQYQCGTCGKLFVTPNYLKVHEKIHLNQRNFACQLCDKKFTQEKILTKHMLVHSDERPHQCSICGNTFKRSEGLSEHLKLHTDDRPFECATCGLCFARRSRLKRHEVIHLEVKPHICNICGRQFARYTALRLHLRTHGIDVTVDTTAQKS